MKNVKAGYEYNINICILFQEYKKAIRKMKQNGKSLSRRSKPTQYYSSRYTKKTKNYINNVK